MKKSCFFTQLIDRVGEGSAPRLNQTVFNGIAVILGDYRIFILIGVGNNVVGMAELIELRVWYIILSDLLKKVDGILLLLQEFLIRCN